MSRRKDLLEDDGFLLIMTPYNEDLSKETVYCPCCNHTFHRWQHVRSWNKESLEKELKKHGYKILGMISCNFEEKRKPIGLINVYTKLRRIFKKDFNKPHFVCIATHEDNSKI